MGNGAGIMESQREELAALSFDERVSALQKHGDLSHQEATIVARQFENSSTETPASISGSQKLTPLVQVRSIAPPISTSVVRTFADNMSDVGSSRSSSLLSTHSRNSSISSIGSRSNRGSARSIDRKSLDLSEFGIRETGPVFSPEAIAAALNAADDESSVSSRATLQNPNVCSDAGRKQDAVPEGEPLNGQGGGGVIWTDEDKRSDEDKPQSRQGRESVGDGETTQAGEDASSRPRHWSSIQKAFRFAAAASTAVAERRPSAFTRATSFSERRLRLLQEKDEQRQQNNGGGGGGGEEEVNNAKSEAEEEPSERRASGQSHRSSTGSTDVPRLLVHEEGHEAKEDEEDHEEEGRKKEGSHEKQEEKEELAKQSSEREATAKQAAAPTAEPKSEGANPAVRPKLQVKVEEEPPLAASQASRDLRNFTKRTASATSGTTGYSESPAREGGNVFSTRSSLADSAGGGGGGGVAARSPLPCTSGRVDSGASHGSAVSAVAANMASLRVTVPSPTGTPSSQVSSPMPFFSSSSSVHSSHSKAEPRRHSRSRQSSVVVAKVSYPVPGGWRIAEKRVLGSGSFGQVFLGLNTRTGELLAVKRLSIPTAQIEEEAAQDNALSISEAAAEEDSSAGDDGSFIGGSLLRSMATAGGEGGSVRATSGRSGSTRRSTTGDGGVQYQDVKQEIELMRSLDHHNIVRYLGAELHQSSQGLGSTSLLYVLQEWAPGGSLGALVRSFGPLEAPVQRRYVRSILRGLSFLHDKAVVHRDLKPDNVLLDDAGECKIADFGASKRLRSNGLDTFISDMTIKGTPYYMAPEQMTREDADRKSDVWSLGGVALFMATGDFPWKHASGFENIVELNPFMFFRKVRELVDVTPIVGLPPEKLKQVGATAGAADAEDDNRSVGSRVSSAKEEKPVLPILERCFVRDPEKRTSAAELLSALRSGSL